MNETTQLLMRWQAGDEAALGNLLEMHLPFVRQRVRERLGPRLRAKVTSDDVVQDAVVEFLRYGPRYVIESERQLHALLARIVATTVGDHGNWFLAVRRRMSAETPLASSHDLVGDEREDPAAHAHRSEMADRLRLAIELLGERDRRLIVWRSWEKRPFAVIGSDLGLSEEAARTAWRRAVDKLRQTMARLRRGELDALLETNATDDED